MCGLYLHLNTFYMDYYYDLVYSMPFIAISMLEVGIITVDSYHSECQIC